MLSGDFIIDPRMIRLCKWVARKYFSPLLRPIKLAIPAAQNISIEQVVRFIGPSKSNYQKGSIPERIVQYLSVKGEVRQGSLIKKFGVQSVRALQKLVADGVIEISDVPKAKYSQRFDKYLEINTLSNADIKAGAVGQKVIDLLSDRGAIRLSEIRTVTGASQATIRSLVNKGCVRLVLRKSEDEPLKSQSDARMHPGSTTCIADDLGTFLEKAVVGGYRDSCLVAGLDGRAMSNLIVHLARLALSKGMSALFIFPELDKITETAALMREGLGISSIEIHAHLSPHLRVEAHYRILNDDGPRIVLGTRGAAFTAFPGLNMLIISGDGEYGMQETSSPAYNAREVALKRSELENIPCIILSSVPSMESYRMAVDTKLSLHVSCELENKINNLGIRFLSRKEFSGEYPQGSLISSEVLERIRGMIQADESVLFFINRRGYASFVRCSSCHKAVICDNCGYAMTLYKSNGLLICHRCRASKPYVYTCPLCSRGHLSPVGFGTQRMETELRKLFFDKKVIRLDSDLSGVDEREAELLVASGSSALIVGTQKIGTTRFARLPKLALIFGFDFMVNYPDFRCREKAVRTLASLADRIEPSDDQESILIETSMEELPFYKNLQDFNLKGILNIELEERKMHSFPPYVEQLGLALDSTKQDALSEAEGQLEVMLNKLSQRFDDISFYKLQPVSMKARSGHQNRSFILSAPDIFKRSAEICKFLNSFQKIVGRDVKLSINTDPSAFI